MAGVTSISWAKGFTSPFMNSTCHYGRVWWDQLITVNKPHHWCQSLPGQSHIHWKKKNYLKPAAEKPPSDSRRIHLLILKQWNKQPDTVGFGKKTSAGVALRLIDEHMPRIRTRRLQDEHNHIQSTAPFSQSADQAPTAIYWAKKQIANAFN